MQDLKSILLSDKPEEEYQERYSVSKIKTFKQCPAQYKYSYIEKLPKKDHDFLIYGKFLHQALELFYKGIIEKSNLPYHILMSDSLKVAYKEWKDKLTREQFIEGKETLLRHLQNISKEEQPTILSAERPFYIDIEGRILLVGFIDRIQQDKDGIIHVADYKTTKNKKYLKNDWFQLLTYAFVLLLEDPTIEKIRGSYILLRHDFEYITKEFSRQEILSVEETFLNWSKEIQKERLFRPITSPLCKFCSFLEYCDAGQRIAGVPDESLNKFGATSW